MCSECFKSKPAEAWRAIGFNKHLLAVIWRLSLIWVMKSSETLGDIPERSHTHQWNFPKRPPPHLPLRRVSSADSKDIAASSVCLGVGGPSMQICPPALRSAVDPACTRVTAVWQMLLLGFAAVAGSLTALLTVLLWLKSQYKCSILGQYMQTSFNCGIWGCWDLQGSVWCCEISVCADPNTPHMPGFYLGGRWVELASSLL